MTRSTRLEFGSLVVVATAALLSCGPETPPRPIGAHRSLRPESPRELIGERIPEERPTETATRPPPPVPAAVDERFSIDPGLWIFNASGIRSNELTGEREQPKALITDVRVEVRVQLREEREVVEIHFAKDDPDRASKAEPLVGAIRPDPLDPGKRILTAQGRDQQVDFRIDGTVNGRGEVRGTIVGKDFSYAPEKGPWKIYGFFSLDREAR